MHALLNWAIALSDVRTLFFDNSLIALHSFSFTQKIKDRSSLLSVRSIHKSDVPSSANWTYMTDSRGGRKVGAKGLQGDVVYLSWSMGELVYEPKCGGRGVVAGSQPMRTAVHITWHGAQINHGDLTPYLTYGWSQIRRLQKAVDLLEEYSGFFLLELTF